MNNSNINLAHLLPLLIPLAIIELALLIWALLDIIRRKHVKGGKVLWILIVVLINLFGPIAYFLFGRGEDEPEDEDDTNSK